MKIIRFTTLFFLLTAQIAQADAVDDTLRDLSSATTATKISALKRLPKLKPDLRLADALINALTDESIPVRVEAARAAMLNVDRFDQEVRDIRWPKEGSAPAGTSWQMQVWSLQFDDALIAGLANLIESTTGVEQLTAATSLASLGWDAKSLLEEPSLCGTGIEERRPWKASNALDKVYARNSNVIISLINSDNHTVVLNAIYAIPMKEQGVVLDFLRRCVMHANPVRRAIAAACGHWDERGELIPLVALLSDRDDRVRRRALLGHHPSDFVLQSLTERYLSGNRSLKLSIQELICCSNAPATYVRLIEIGMRDASVDVRRVAADCAAGHEIAIDESLLRSLLRDRNENIQQAAMIVAGYANNRPELVKLVLNSGEAGVKQGAAFVLLARAGADCLPLVRKHLKLNSSEIGSVPSSKETVLAGIGRHGRAALKFAKQLLEDEYPQWRGIGIEALAKILGDDCLETVMDACKNESELIRSSAARALVKLTNPSAFEAIESLLRDRSDTVRYALYQAMEDTAQVRWIDSLEKSVLSVSGDEVNHIHGVVQSIRRSLDHPERYRINPESDLDNPQRFITP